MSFTISSVSNIFSYPKGLHAGKNVSISVQLEAFAHAKPSSHDAQPLQHDDSNNLSISKQHLKKKRTDARKDERREI